MIKDIIYRVIELISVFWISMLVMLPSTTIVRFWGSQNIVEYTVVFACGLVTALVSVFFIAYREGYKQKEMGARTPVVLLTALIIQMIISIPFGFRLYIAGPTSSLSHIFAILIRLPVDVYWVQFYPFGGMMDASTVETALIKPARQKDEICIVLITGRPAVITGLDEGIFVSAKQRIRKDTDIYVMSETAFKLFS